MPIITSIKPQRNGKRVNIYLDGKFGFGIDLENFVVLDLKVEQELTEQEVIVIVKKAEFQKTFDKLLKFATLRPRSVKEVNDWFKRRRVHESLQPELFNRLKRYGLVNDREFAKWWVGQRIEFKSKSKKEITYELRNKGVSKNTIEEVLGETKIDEVKMARELLEKKTYKWRGLPAREARQKMSRYLFSKGFTWEVIEKVVTKR